MNDNYEERLEKARARVKQLREFYQHLATYVCVNIFLFVLNLITSDDLWFYWVTIPWGLGLALHAYTVFGEQRFLGEEWEQRKIMEMMGKQKEKDPFDQN